MRKETTLESVKLISSIFWLKEYTIHRYFAKWLFCPSALEIFMFNIIGAGVDGGC